MDADASYRSQTRELVLRLLAYASMVAVVFAAFECGRKDGNEELLEQAAIPIVGTLYEHIKHGTIDQEANRRLASEGTVMQFSRRDEEFGKVASYGIVRAHRASGYTIVEVKTVRNGVEYRETIHYSSLSFRHLTLGKIEPVKPKPLASGDSQP